MLGNPRGFSSKQAELLNQVQLFPFGPVQGRFKPWALTEGVGNAVLVSRIRGDRSGPGFPEGPVFTVRLNKKGLCAGTSFSRFWRAFPEFWGWGWGPFPGHPVDFPGLLGTVPSPGAKGVLSPLWGEPGPLWGV